MPQRKPTEYHVVKMHFGSPIFRRLPKIVIAQKGYAIITKEGIEFVRKRYTCLGVLDSKETKLYEFLLRLLSFGGTLPLALIRKWRESEILKKALNKHYVTVTPFKRGLPKKEAQDIFEEIWGKIPKGIYV